MVTLTVYVEEEAVVIPAGLDTLETFRRWALSEEFPERGRIDYLQGEIEVDMSPEKLQTHGVLKSELCCYVGQLVAAKKLGQVFVDRARLTSVIADLSCEPDVLFVSWEALKSGRVRYLPAKPGDEDQLEIEGAADLVVEVVSKSSVNKDTKKLPPLYAASGVRELWITDARGPELRFQIFHLHEGRHVEAELDPKGFQRSLVLGRSIRLRREAGPVAGTLVYFVDES